MTHKCSLWEAFLNPEVPWAISLESCNHQYDMGSKKHRYHPLFWCILWFRFRTPNLTLEKNTSFLYIEPSEGVTLMRSVDKY